MTLDIAVQVQNKLVVFWICEAFDVVDIAVKEGFQSHIASLDKNGD